MILDGLMLGFMKLKLNTTQQSSFKVVELRLHILDLKQLIFTKELTSKIRSRVGWWDGLSDYKANFSPAKLKLADIGR